MQSPGSVAAPNLDRPDSDREPPPVDPFAGPGVDLAALFALDRSYTFLNHGSFGSTPLEILALQDRLRREIEARPIEMLARRLGPLLRTAAQDVARFVGTEGRRLGFVTNATEGINAVLRSMRWEAGDEVVVIDHVYNAMRQSIRRLGDESGVVLREIPVPVPVDSPRRFVEAIEGALTARTRLVLIDHVTSPTALVVPVAEIVRIARARGVATIVDGAHAPGSIDLAIDAIGADAYAANLHKWCCAPKGSGILVTSPELSAQHHPLATSHDYGRGFATEFDWQGTRDPTAWLDSPGAIAFFERFGWPAVRRRNHAMATWAQRELCRAWDVAPLSPLDGSMLASMATVPVPASVRARFATVPEFEAALHARRLELPVIDFAGAWHIRVSCHLHTSPAMIDRLGGEMLALAAK